LVQRVRLLPRLLDQLRRNRKHLLRVLARRLFRTISAAFAIISAPSSRLIVPLSISFMNIAIVIALFAMAAPIRASRDSSCI
jgi:hypothetical protein